MILRRTFLFLTPEHAGSVHLPSKHSLKWSQRTNSSRHRLSNEGSGCEVDGSCVEVVRDFGRSWEQAGSDLGGIGRVLGRRCEGVVRDM